MDGDYYYDSRKSVLEWQLAVIDTSNPSGSLEFTIAGIPDDFFPVNVAFYSTKTLCDFQVITLWNFNLLCEAVQIFNAFFWYKYKYAS